jgi:hypothetical protein
VGAGRFSAIWGLIIALHQYRRSAAAVIVSLLGWFLVVRGVLLLVVLQTYISAGNAMEHGAVPLGVFGVISQRRRRRHQ